MKQADAELRLHNMHNAAGTKGRYPREDCSDRIP
jgi:hypothetical protein